MAGIPWDRVLETLHRHFASDVMLVPGSPPAVRCRTDGWRFLAVPALDAADVRGMAEELLANRPRTEANGWVHADFWYGDVVYCRGMAFGYPETTVLLVSRILEPPPPGDLVCGVCGRAATVHVAEVLGGKPVETHLCADHAKHLESPDDVAPPKPPMPT
jgi:hypothetical protein